LRVFSAVKIYIVVVWLKILCNLVGGCWCYRGTYCLYLKGRGVYNPEDEGSRFLQNLVTPYQTTW
jgi:hypothetical protein